MKFMHISDLHLGIESDIDKEWAQKREQRIWNTFSYVVAEAGRLGVDFLLISGDLFHVQPSRDAFEKVNAIFAQIPQVKIVLVAGNHDYMWPGCSYERLPWAQNVFYIKEENITCVDFAEKNVAIYGLSYWHEELPERLYDNLGVLNPERINILLAHGGDEKHIPYSAEQILEQGVDYIAGGHLHTRKEMVKNRAIIAGPLEPTELKEVGRDHGYWIGEIQKSVVGVEQSVVFVPVI